MLEKIGAKVDGIVSDGASTNGKVWKEFGISGTFDNVKNYFIHPLDKSRNIYMFSDAPHLMKTIRNRLFNKKYLRVSIIYFLSFKKSIFLVNCNILPIFNYFFIDINVQIIIGIKK